MGKALRLSLYTGHKVTSKSCLQYINVKVHDQITNYLTINGHQVP